MADDDPSVPIEVEVVTAEVALGNAARLLYNAEVVTDLKLMERLEKLADSWIAIAQALMQREA
jgi:hypothetical protein